MRHLICRSLLAAVVLMIAGSGGVAVLIAQATHQHPQPGTHPAGGAHRHPAAAKMTNPVKADEASIAAGKNLYDKNCAGCHGDTGKGDGAMGADLDPKPPDLTDAEWKHGSTDGELFLVIRDGAKGTGMKPFSKKMTAHQIWDVVNYIRTLGPTGSVSEEREYAPSRQASPAKTGPTLPTIARVARLPGARSHYSDGLATKLRLKPPSDSAGG